MANKKRLIDANEVKERIWYGNSDPSGMRQYASGFIDNAPTVDAVEVVHGNWVMRGGKRYCSACRQMACVTRDSDDFWYTVGTNYCPNCGAKMAGERSNDV